MKFIVTFKLDKNPKHDPKHKVIDQCPCNMLKMCSDSTGQHHSRIISAKNSLEAKYLCNSYLGYHITRIEEV